MITQEHLKTALHYNELTGVFTWLNVERYNKHLNGRTAGSINSSGYHQVRINKRFYPAHRLAWFYVHGYWPVGEIDHIDHVKTNNAIANLRDVEPQENKRNIPMHRRNKTGVAGAVYRAKTNRYISRIGVEGVHIYLGSFTTLKEAERVRKNAESEYGFHANHGKGYAV